MTLCAETFWKPRVNPRRSFVGRTVTPRRPQPKITFQTKREADLWAAIYADDSCHPYHRWEVERVNGVFSAAVYDANTGQFSHWAEP